MPKNRRMSDLDYAIDAYLDELTIRGRSPATRLKYQEVLFQFATITKLDYCDEATPAICRDFLGRWATASPSTLALYVSILRGFFAFLEDETVITESPMANIKRPPRKRPEDLDVVTVSGNEVMRIFEACQQWDEVLCISLLMYLGPRRGATAKLRRKDLDLDRGVVKFKEKGGKVITKPMPDELWLILRTAEEASVWIGPEDYVIPNRRPTRRKERSDKVIYRIVKDVAQRARVSSHVHALRAAFAVKFLEDNEGDLEALKNLLGHARYETTGVYLRRLEKSRSMERVRGLSWGTGLRSFADLPPAGFEPAFRESGLPDVVGRKLEELRARNEHLSATRETGS